MENVLKICQSSLSGNERPDDKTKPFRKNFSCYSLHNCDKELDFIKFFIKWMGFIKTLQNVNQ
jgi:hypothetical protein